MDKNKVCRTCLFTELLYPIFPNSVDNEPYSTALEITTGLKVTIDDGLPQFICTKCVYFINKSLEFRLQCKQNEQKLLNCLTKDKNIETKTHESKISELELLLRSNKDCKNNDCNDENKCISSATKDNSDIESCINQDNSNKNTYEDHDKNKIILNYETSIKEAKVIITDKDPEYVVRISSLNPKKTIISVNNDEANSESFEYLNDDEVDRNNCVTELDSNDVDANNKVTTSNILVETVNIAAENSNITANTSNIAATNSYITATTSNIVTTGSNAAKILNTEAKTTENVDTTNDKDLTSNIIHPISTVEKSVHSVLTTRNSQILTSKQEIRKLDMERLGNKKMVVSKKKNTVKCEVCDKTMLKNSLKTHIKVKHSGLGPVCEHCGRRFGNKHRLEEHYRSKHGYEKHKCGHCSFESASLLSLKNHERLHTNDKPYVCVKCGVKFHAAYLLRQHSYLHSSEYTYKCNQCTRKFKSGNNLRSHMSNCHSEEKIKCRVCDKKFSSISYAKRHMKRMHNGSQD